MIHPSLTDDDARHASHAINTLNAHRTQRAESAVHFILMLVFVVLGALALLHYLTPCDGTALCMAAVITPTRSGPAGAVLRMLERWRLRLALADAELALDRVQSDIELLPRVQDELRRNIDSMQVQLATLQPARGVQP